MDLETIVERLSDPAFYPEEPSSVEVIQTHVSFIFLTDEHAFKVKKPVDFGFLDYTTLEKRRHMCRRELELNSRLSPETYLGVAEITLDGDDLALDGSGEVVEVAVKMRRLPAESMLRAVLARGEADDELFTTMAKIVARFHDGAVVHGDQARLKGLEGVRFNCEENFEQTEQWVGDVMDEPMFERIRTATRHFLDRKAGLFEARAATGHVVDGHGDLHLDSICALDPPVIYDCIEFNDRFRLLDAAEEVAFLAMDLEMEGYDRFAKVFVDAYVDASGDEELRQLLDFYRCYRAYVRAKVACFQLGDPHVPHAQKEEARQTARRYYELADRYAAAFDPRILFLTTGLTGSGKSVLARTLAGRYDLHVVRSDGVRKELLGIEADERRWVHFNTREYSPEMTKKTYDEMFRRAADSLRRGRSVILDGCFTTRAQRQAAYELADEVGVTAVVLECSTSEDVVRARLQKREAKSGDISDGRWEIYQHQKGVYEAPDEIPADRRIILDRDRPAEELVEEMADRLPEPWRFAEANPVNA